MTSERNTQVAVKNRPRDEERVALAELRRVQRVFAECEWPDQRTFARARKRARARALQVFAGAGYGDAARQTALVLACAEMFRALRVELATSTDDGSQLARELVRLTQLPGLALAREVLRAPELLVLAPDVAIAVVLATVSAFGPLRGASLWRLTPAEEVVCRRYVGESAPSRGARELAQRLLAPEPPELPASGERRLLLGRPLGRSVPPAAALVGLARPWMSDECEAFLAEAALVLDAVLERDSLLAGNADAERALIEASERKLTRMGFDLHDGPIQDVAALAQDVRLFGDQLKPLLGALDEHKLVRGRIEDLDSQLGAIDAGLRQLAQEVRGATVLLNRPFNVAVLDQVEAFFARTGIEPRLTIDGDTATISTSQQIALLNIIHQSLDNIREHADASTVQVSVTATEEGVEARVSDDGRGFDLEKSLMRAAREGRVGLLAINERARLLGGHCRIDTRPGGPTVVSVAFQRWLPMASDAASGRASA